MKFKVGDEVEVVKGGLGVSEREVGKRTVITDIGGEYFDEKDAVRTLDFKNTLVGNWISSKSFKLIRRSSKGIN